MEYIREKTTSQVVCGPFMTTGASALASAVVLTTVDEAVIQKHGVTAVVSVTAATWSTITNLTGYFNLEITTGMSDTPGRLDLCIRDDDVCLPYTKSFMVIGAQVYDSLWGSSSGAYPSVNVMQINSQASAATALEGHISSIIAGITSMKAETSAIKAKTDNLPADPADDSDIDTQLAAIKAETALIVADTDELQTDDIPTALSGLDTKIDAVKAETALIVADTDELQTDDYPTSIAAIKTETTAIKAKTDNLPVDPASETNVNANETKIDAIKAETALIVEDTGELQVDDTPTAIAGLDTKIDAIKAETALIVADTDELQTDDYPASIAAIKAETTAIKLALSTISSTALMDSTYEGDYKLRDYLRLSGAVLFGLSSGGDTTTLRFRDMADTKDRIIAEVSTKGNREVMTLDPA